MAEKAPLHPPPPGPDPDIIREGVAVAYHCKKGKLGAELANLTGQLPPGALGKAVRWEVLHHTTH